MLMRYILKVLEGFHHWAARRTAGITAQCTEDGEWEYPPVDDVMDAAGIWPINEYIKRHQATFVALVSCQTIYYLCTGAEWMPVYSQLMRWWDQDMVCEE